MKNILQRKFLLGKLFFLSLIHERSKYIHSCLLFPSPSSMSPTTASAPMLKEVEVKGAQMGAEAKVLNEGRERGAEEAEGLVWR